MRTAVILAGGTGSRLQPITATLPKPLVPAPKFPMIQMLLEQLDRHNFEKVFILIGYKCKFVREFLMSLHSELEIIIIETPVEMSPAERLIYSSQDFPESYMLMYCDNFISDDDLTVHLNNARASTKNLTMLVEPREIGNVGFQNSKVVFLPETRSQHTPYVELGYLIIRDSKFFHAMLQKSRSLHLTFEFFANSNNLEVNELNGDLTSISSLARYNALRKHRHTVLLDRDGILNAKMPVADYVKSWLDFQRNEDVWDTLESASLDKNIDFLIITNQPGVARGMVASDFLEELHTSMSIEALKRGFNILAFYVCTHGWNDACECRKPLPGLIQQAISDFELKEKNVIFIGDEDRDLLAAKAGGISGKKAHSVNDFHDIWSEVLSELELPI